MQSRPLVNIKGTDLLPLVPKGTPVFCVGGGPSLAGFNWDWLKDKFTIAVTAAFRNLPTAKIIYFSDAQRFWEWYGAEALRHPAIKVTIGKLLVPGVIILKDTGRNGVESRLGYIRNGNNSGYAAINLVMTLGARKIYLLGYDMRPDKNGKTHYHKGHRVPTRPSAYVQMLPYFPKLRIEADKMGVEIINVVGEEGSALTAFPTFPLTKLTEVST